MNQKQALRERLYPQFDLLWPENGPAKGCPLFPGQGRAAERLRRLPEYRLARTIVVMPDAVLLQVRINALNDGKTLLAATPGLKQGLVRLDPGEVPVGRRSRDLKGPSLFAAGLPLRFPQKKIPRADLLVGPALAVDPQGRTLGDGRGLLDLTYALLRALGSLDAKAPVAVVAADEQVMEGLPADAWDLQADILITPSRTVRTQAVHAAPNLNGLPAELASLPLVQAVQGHGPAKK